MPYIRLTTVISVTIALALTLGSAPRQAEAGVCKKLGFSNQCVVRKDIKKNAINSARVLNDSLTASDLRDESGADGLDTPIDLNMMGGAPETVAQVTVTAPTAGWVIVNSGGTAHFTMIAGRVGCSLTTGTTVEANDKTTLSGFPDDADPVALTELFPAVVGSNIFRLVCEEESGEIFLNDIRLTAAFYPTRY